MQDIAGCEITAEAASMMSQMDSGNDIQVDISGSDYDVLTQIADDLTSQISALDDTENVKNSLESTILPLPLQ